MQLFFILGSYQKYSAFQVKSPSDICIQPLNESSLFLEQAITSAYGHSAALTDFGGLNRPVLRRLDFVLPEAPESLEAPQERQR